MVRITTGTNSGTAMMLGGAAAALLLAAGPWAATARADMSMGVIGDSYSESWVFHGPRTNSRTWSDQIGSHTTETHITLGGIGYKSTPAGEGYAGNWAYGGATSQNALDHQVQGLSNQISSGQVRVAVVAIGINDFGNAEDYDQYKTKAALQGALNQDVQTVTQHIDNIVTQLQAASPDDATIPLVIGNIPDATATPDYQDHTFAPNLSGATAMIRSAIQQANANIEQIAHDHQGSIPVVNLFALSDLGAGAGKFTLAGDNDVNLLKGHDPNDPTNGDPTKAFWADDFHPSTIPQGLFANAYITALRAEYGWLDSEITLLPNSKILADAGLSGNFNFDYSRYVTTAPTPTAAAGAAALLGLMGLFMMWRKRRAAQG